MAEHITDEQVEKLFKLADEIVRAPSRFTKDFVVENLALGVADLCGVIDRLREQLAEIGETRQEWGLFPHNDIPLTGAATMGEVLKWAEQYEQMTKPWNPQYQPPVIKSRARSQAVGPWREVEQDVSE